MNKILLFTLINLFFISCFSQNVLFENKEIGGSYPTNLNNEKNPCISKSDYVVIEQQNIENCKKLGIEYRKKIGTITTTVFDWPLKTASGFEECDYYYIGNYLDQDQTTPGIKDWNCGSVTYDGHMGTDICTYPFPFSKMDNNQIEIIAAADGTIINRVDGNFDKNCAMDNSTANYIVIQHADGSCVMYWHMKKNSLTSKQLGSKVVKGEYLGIVGSSGSSTAPHLHFEVLNEITVNTINDTYAGTCNTLNQRSWWIKQKPYTEPAIIQASVHSALAVIPGCPTTETTNEASSYLPGASAKFYIFLRNETSGLVSEMRIINPDNSTFTSWTHNSNASHLSSYWISTKNVPTVPGIYTFEAKYNGTICTKSFTVESNLSTTNFSNPDKFTIFPNPTHSEINIENMEVEGLFVIIDLSGRIVFQNQIDTTSKKINLDLSSGLYLYKVMSHDKIIHSGKIAIE